MDSIVSTSIEVEDFDTKGRFGTLTAIAKSHDDQILSDIMSLNQLHVDKLEVLQ